MSNWLNDVVIVNESRDMRVAGDVTLHRTAGEACQYLEPWWVKDGEGYAFTAAGNELVLGATDHVFVREVRLVEDGEALVLGWLNSFAQSVREVRRFKASRSQSAQSACDEADNLPETIEGLIAYIGYEG